MSYALEAVIASDEVLRLASREIPGSRVVPLGQGLIVIAVVVSYELVRQYGLRRQQRIVHPMA
ncbi:hypothetical protein AB0R11_14115, partial [Streptomyces fradiae]|uniref:hypothetical protein n=1 Tax=Streptomyces fradiae TaxID=1906 RepID=UPI0034466CFC